MTRAALALIGFQAVWFACALGAARGLSWPGICAAAFYVTLHLATAREKYSAMTILLASAVLGFVAESAFVALGVLRYGAPWPSADVAPAWIVALWLAFGATLTPMRALFGSVPRAAIAGFVLGPLAYEAGQSLGAMSLQSPAWKALLILALVWTLALPILLALPRAIERRGWRR